VTVSAATGGSPPGTVVKSRPQVEGCGRTFATHAELLDLLAAAHDRDTGGKRFYSYVANHTVDLYDVLVRWHQTSRDEYDGWLRITYTQAGRMLYDDVESLSAGGSAKINSIRRWLNRLQSAGVIEWRGIRGHFLEFRLLEVPAPVAQLDRAAAFWRRALESRRERHERRLAPWRRRGGRKGCGRWRRASGPGAGASSSYPRELANPGDGGAPKGSPPVQHQQEQTRERARATMPASRPAASAAPADPVVSSCPPIARAALDELRGLLTEGEGSWPEGRTPGPGVPLEALALALWEVRCPGREPRLSREVAAGLRRHGEVLDARHGPGAAVQLVDELMADVRDGRWRDRYGADDVELTSLAWVARQVKVAARAAVAGQRRRRGTRGKGRGRADTRTGTWRSRTGEQDSWWS
jgi:hypothetical protein